jgi:peptidoglycan hydrolase-like protein with peptidoglycan-binding domain
MIIKLNDRGIQVQMWQTLLIKLGFAPGKVDGVFGAKTLGETHTFQEIFKLNRNGKVDDFSFILACHKAKEKGLSEQEKKILEYYPSKPNFSSLSKIEIENIFGEFKYEVYDNGNIKILDNYERENIVNVYIRQLDGIKIPYANSYSRGNIRFHKKAKEQLIAFFNTVQKEKLNKLILTYEGSFNPRFIRGSKYRLSTHSFGIAFDINKKWNDLNKIPANIGEQGSIRELVHIANNYGFYWGGHFSRLDGMHFEIAKLL